MIAFTLAITASAALTLLAIKVCSRFNWMARPRSDRWHSRPVALFGGVPIWLSFVVVSLLFVPFANLTLWKLIGIATLMFVVGLIDDVVSLSPRWKLLLQLLAVSLVFASGIVYPFRESLVVNLVVSTVWLVGLVNAFNLIDNMDGLSAGTALITAAYLLQLFVTRGASDVVTLLAIFSGVLFGFLIFNFQPAKIFMGDSGSLFIGFLLASVTILDVTHLSSLSALVLIPVLVFVVPIVDTLFVSITRRLRGQPISQGGTDHTSHRLVRFGFGERSAVVILYGLSAISGALALLIRDLAFHQGVALAALWFLIVALFAVNLFRASADELIQSQLNGLRKVFHPDSVSFLLDPIALSLAMYGAYLLRFSPTFTPADVPEFMTAAPIVVLSQFGCLIASGVYRDSWWRCSRDSTYRIVRALMLGSALGLIILLGTDRFVGHSRSVFAMDFVLALAMLVGIRQSPFFARDIATLLPKRSKSEPVLVLGTYDGAEPVLRILKQWDIKCVGLVDLNHGSDTGRRVWGYRVLGGLDHLGAIAKAHDIDEIILSENQLPPEQMARVLQVCESLTVKLSTIDRHRIFPAKSIAAGKSASEQGRRLAARAGAPTGHS